MFKALQISIIIIICIIGFISNINALTLETWLNTSEETHYYGLNELAQIQMHIVLTSPPALNSFPSARYYLGEIAYQNRAYNEAINEYHNLDLKDPESEYYDESLFHIGRSYTLLKEYDKAQEAYLQALHWTEDESMQRNSEYWTGRTYYNAGNYEKASEVLGEVIHTSIDENNRIDAYYWLGLSYIGTNEYERAIEIFREYLYHLAGVRSEREAWSRYWIGHSLFHLLTYELAIQEFSKLLISYPNFKLADDVCYQLGLAEMYLGNYDKANNIWLELIRKQSFFAHLSTFGGEKHISEYIFNTIYFSEGKYWWFDDTLYLIAWCYYQIGEYGEALTALNMLKAYSLTEHLLSQAYYSTGIIEYQLGNYIASQQSLALLIFKKIEEPLRDDAIYWSAWSQYKNDDIYSAISTFDKLIIEYPSSPYSERGEFYIAKFLYLEKDYHTSILKYENFLKIYPNSELRAMVYYDLGWSYYKQKNYVLSLNNFEEYLNIDIEDDLYESARLQAAKAAFYANKYETSRKHCRFIIEKYPMSNLADDSQYLLAQSFMREEKYDLAEQEFRKMLKKYPNSNFCIYAQFALGDIYFTAKKYYQAIKEYKKLEDYSEANQTVVDNARYNIERAYFYLGIYKHELDISRNFIYKYPESPKSLELQNYIAHYYELGGNYTQAIYEYHRLLKLPNNNASDKVWLSIGHCYFLQKNYDKTIKSFNQIIENFSESSSSAEAQFLIAETYFAMDDYNQAIKNFQLVINNYPESVLTIEAYYQIGICFQNIDRNGEARFMFTQIIEQYPTQPIKYKAMLEITKSFYKEKFYDKTIKMAQEILEYAPIEYQIEAEFLIGNCYFEQDEYEKALKIYADIPKHYAEFPVWTAQAYYQAGRSAEILHKREEAIKYYEKVLSIEPVSELDQLTRIRLASLKSEVNSH